MQHIAQADYLDTWGQAGIGVAEVPGQTVGQGGAGRRNWLARG